ncbi:Aste57867_22589 [Aphanomyces stellatus]|uniref:Aste57867_22589 protein n=1 Tax=Aphanomyces stellatus TaxID=120398 RepID=A0A485LKQ1_9STRA|nr:hypothetical protein As57867_022519 [Aphanomyces stellatus]KAF0706097.1 hypothetical protein As57867_006799 [Aphanomyces stellatus]VFT83783.1 Aste57867_6819 [Aphanomyces stellatus]VFT99246.1 Aste57867_22589 [Aphanomyces stellatus]
MGQYQRWERFYSVESENLELRATVSDLQQEVAQLRVWKEQAVKLMTSWGPKRTKVQRERQETLELKKKLLEMEQQVMERVALSEMLKEMKVQDEQLLEKLSTTMRENEQLKEKIASENASHHQTRRQLSFMEDCFEKHVEEMLVVRSRFEGPNAPHNEILNPVDVVRLEGESLPAFQERKLVSGMIVLAQKCVQWIERRLEMEQTKDASYHEELQSLSSEKKKLTEELRKSNELVHSIEATKENQLHQILVLQSDSERNEQSVSAAKLEMMKCTQHALEGKDIMKRLLRDVRQYLHLTQLEVKKKFGYVPDAITHHNVWENISTSMKDFDTFLQDIMC